jgi:hypothetical protein
MESLMTLGNPVEFKKALNAKRLRNRVYRVGIEVEGAWTTLPKGTRPIRDGSLDPFAIDLVGAGIFPHGSVHPSHGGSATTIRDERDGAIVAYVGEIASQILEVREIDAWLRAFYPQHCDHVRCGLHLHMSFGNARTYGRLMDPRYPATIIEGVRQWAEANALPPAHPLWPRLRGESVYCQHVFDADGQVQNTHKDFDQRRAGHRYTAINYCYQAHGTLECRLLTMFNTVDLAISAVRHLIYLTNAFLVETATRERRERVSVDDNLQPATEIRRIFI